MGTPGEMALKSAHYGEKLRKFFGFLCSAKMLGDKYMLVKRGYMNARDTAKTSGNRKTKWMYLDILQQIPVAETKDDPLAKVSVGDEDPTIVLNGERS